MHPTLLKQIQALERAPITDLRAKYRELFGEEPRSRHQQQLFRRIAWRMQAQAEGGLSERAQRRALEIANDQDIRVLAPSSFESKSRPVMASSRLDPRIPAAGTVLTRDFRGRSVAVKVLVGGFLYQGRRYRSLSAIANAVTGTRWNGLAFFGLTADRQAGEVQHGVTRG